MGDSYNSLVSVETGYPNDLGPRGYRSVRRRNILVLTTLFAFALSSAYAAFALVSQIDQLFLPGNELRFNLPFRTPGLDIAPPDALAANEDRINVLLIGIDRRPGQAKDEAYRSDSIIIMTIHPQAKQASMISLPRDLWVQIPLDDGEMYEGRINEAYAQGVLTDHPGGGPDLLKGTLEYNFGIDIDYYVVLDFEAFVELIDALGGIDIDIPDHVAYLYSTDERPGSERWFELTPGRHHLSGDDALAYSRYRQDSDLYRIERQQRVIFAAVDRALSLGMLTRAPDLWDRYHDAVDTDISAFRVPGLAALLRDIPSDRIFSYTLNDAVVGVQTPAGASVLRLLPEIAAPIIGAAFRPPEVARENARVAVLNATGAPGFAHEFELYLGLKGISRDNLTFGNAPGANGSAVLYLPQAKTTARFIARWLDLDDELREATPEEAAVFLADAQVAVILGDGLKAPQVRLPGSDDDAADFVDEGTQYDPYSPPPTYFDEPDTPPTPVAPPVQEPVAEEPIEEESENPFADTPIPEDTPDSNPFDEPIDPSPPQPVPPGTTTQNPFSGG